MRERAGDGRDTERERGGGGSRGELYDRWQLSRRLQRLLAREGEKQTRHCVIYGSLLHHMTPHVLYNEYTVCIIGNK